MNLKKYVKEFLGNSNEIEDKQTTTFKNLDSIESIVSNEYVRSMYFFWVSCIIFVYSIILSLYFNNFSLYFTTYSLIACWIIEISWRILSIWNQNFFNQKIKYFRFMSLYISLSLFLIFPARVPNQTSEYNLQIYYYSIFILNLLYFYYFDFDSILHIIIPILNILIIFGFQYRNNYPNYFFATDIAGNFAVYFVSYFTIKNERLLKIQDQRIQCIEYSQNLMNKMDTMVISMKGNEILFVNDFTRNYFEKKLNFKFIDEALDDNNLISDISINENKIWSIKSYTKYFVESLIINIPSQKNSIIIQEGKSLHEIISAYLSDNKEQLNSFISLGYFNSKNGLNSYEIKIRIINSKEKVVELLIHDITDIKKTEKIKIDTKFKQLLLAKIAHELKTPLITMISLIHNTIQQNHMESPIRNCLNNLNHLSNYSLVIIRDIILYASNIKELNLLVNVIDLREIFDFSNKILITLIQCNENKINKIQTSMQFDNEIDNLIIISDENFLKQILINLISNSYKFTKSGFIKLQAKCIENFVLISVEDSGLGIKDKDHHLIFKEATQLNLDQEYYSNGSGMGLSICKKLSDSLNHKMTFESKYGEGSQFFIKIDCKRKSFLTEVNQNSLPKIKTCLTKKEISRLDLTTDIQKSLKRSPSLIISSKINVLDKIEKESSIEEIKIKDIGNSSRIRKNSSRIRQNSKIYSEISDEDSITVRQKIVVGNDDYLILRNLYVSNSLKITNFRLSLGSFLPEKKMFSIVVVDDHKFIRQTIIKLIEQVLCESQINDIEIIELCDGIELLNTVIKDKSNLIKCIFSDENMEFMNGSEAIRIIRKLEGNNRIPCYRIVSITAFEDIETKNYLSKSGFNSILIKPCTKSNIRNILQNLIINNNKCII